MRRSSPQQIVRILNHMTVHQPMTGYLPGDHVVHVDEDMRITAQKGDVIGWYNEGPPIVPFTSTGPDLHVVRILSKTNAEVRTCFDANVSP